MCYITTMVAMVSRYPWTNKARGDFFRRFSLNCVPNNPIDSKSELVQVMAWRLTCRPQAITRTNADPGLWRIHASTGFNNNTFEWLIDQFLLSRCRKIHTSASVHDWYLWHDQKIVTAAVEIRRFNPSVYFQSVRPCNITFPAPGHDE